MKSMATAGVAALLVLAICAAIVPSEASAHSPIIRTTETADHHVDNGEDIYEGPYEGPAVNTPVETLHPSLSGVLNYAPPAYAAIPGANRATLELLQELQQGPTEYQESLLAGDLIGADIDLDNVRMVATVAELPWVSDGVAGDERIAVNFLTLINKLNPAAAARILDMPFLETFGPADVEALWSLARLADDEVENDTAALTNVLSNPHIADGGGIDDDEAKVVAVLGGVNLLNPPLVEKLLDPSQIHVTERATQGLGREIHLVIIRTGPGSSSTMDLLEFGIRQAETLMGLPLRTDYVGLLVADVLPDFAAGGHIGTNIMIPPEFDVDERSEYPGNRTGLVLAHEAAHYYWFHSALWVDEGAADFMAVASELYRVGRPMEPDNVPCSYYRSIFHLELANPRTGTWGWNCNYALGERMFLDLYSNLGIGRFYPGFRNLYWLSQFEAPGSTTDPIEHVRTAFLSTPGTEDQRALTRLMLARHYGSILLTDTSPVNPSVPALNSRVEGVSLVRRLGNQVIESHSGFAQISASRISDRYWLRLHIPNSGPLPSERTAEYEMVEYYEDGFVFDRRTYTATYEAGYDRDSTSLCCIGFIPNYRWPTGLYWFYVYHAGQKIAEMHLEVTP